jgi:hypothetical protein
VVACATTEVTIIVWKKQRFQDLVAEDAEEVRAALRLVTFKQAVMHLTDIWPALL